MTRRQLFTCAAMSLFIAAIIFMPLRAIVGGKGVSAQKVEGIIWDGSVRNLRIGKLPIGDVNARLHFLPLMLGQAQISLARGDAPFAPGISGSFTRRIGGVSIDKMNANIPIVSLFSPLPAENIELQDFSVRFSAGRCAEASGNIRMTLTSSMPGLALSNGLLARPRCEGAQLLIPLLSQSAMEHVDVRVSGDGSFVATFFLEGDRTEQSVPLALAGFRSVAGGYRMVRKGKF